MSQNTKASNEEMIAASVPKSKVTESQVALKSSSKLSNRLGPPKEISFSDLVPVKREPPTNVDDSLKSHRERTEFDDSSASRRVHLAATAIKHSYDGGTMSSSQSAFERLDKTHFSSDTGHRTVKTKVCTVLVPFC